MTVELLWLVAAAALIVIAVSVAVSASAVVRLAADTARAARSGDVLVNALQEELPRTLASLERAATALEQLSAEGGARLVTADRLAEEGEATMVAVRELARSINDITRGPADTVKGVGKSARMMGEGLAHGADRIRRVITRPGDGP